MFHLLPLFAQAVSTVPVSAPAPAAAPSGAFVPSAIGASAAFAYAMNWLKQWRSFPIVTEHSTEINAMFRAITSFFATVGITFVWSGASHTLTIGNLSFWAVMVGLGHWFSTYAIQHGWEKVFSIVTPVDVPKPVQN